MVVKLFEEELNPYLFITSLWIPPAILSVTSKVDIEYVKGMIPAEQKREKKETKKGTTSESRCGIILSSKLGHSPRALF